MRGAMGMREAAILALVVGVYCWSGVAGAGVVSSPCTVDTDCGVGLYCFACDGAPSVCTEDQALPVSSFAQNYSLPFNKYTWITTHNSYSIEGEPSLLGVPIISPKNQEDSVTNQLLKGVRGLMLDIYELRGDLWLCHSDGICYDFTAFRPLNGTLTEIETFLAANPTEVVTIFIEDYVTTPNALTNAFTKAGLTKYMFPMASMPKDGSDWPTIAAMIATNQRFLVFTSDKTKEASESIAYQWNYMVENQYGSIAEVCTNRAESAVLTDTTKSLILENYFPNDPNMTTACIDNSDILYQALNVCHTAAGNRWANFLAVDFYTRSTGRGVFKAVNTLNGQLHCGCTDIRACQGSTGPGICSVVNVDVVMPALAPTSQFTPLATSATPGGPEASPGPQLPASSSSSLTSGRVNLLVALVVGCLSTL